MLVDVEWNAREDAKGKQTREEQNVARPKRKGASPYTYSHRKYWIYADW
jgi:hypothetical protein